MRSLLLGASFLIAAPAAAAPAAHTLEVHVYASPDYAPSDAAKTLRVARIFARAQAIAGDALSVHLVVKRISSFAPEADASLEQSIVALERTDPGGEADLVVGLVGELPIHTTAMHDLSRARSPGRHLVLRKRASEEEETTLLMHAFAHTLGGVHATAPDRITHAELLQETRVLDKRDVDLLGIALAHHPAMLKDDSELAIYKHEAAVYLHAHAADGGFDKEALTAALDWLTASGSAASGAALSDRDRQWLAEAAVHEQSGRLDLAWQALSQLDPGVRHPAVATLTCRVSLARAPKSDETRDRCRRAAARSPTDPMAILLRAQTEITAGAALVAAESLIRSAELLDRAPADANVWDYFGTLAQGAGCITLAEKAAASIGGDTLRRVRAWADLARRRAAIPRGMRGPEECRMQAELTSVLAHIDQKHWADAETAARRAADAHPEAPAPLALLCETIAQTTRDQAAEPFCTRAIAAAPDASVAHYWLGVIAWRRGSRDAATAQFAKVLELDPDAGHAKEMLRRAKMR